MNTKTIIDRVLKEAMPMAVYEPEVGQAKPILQALRGYFGLETVQKPVWREYITFREGTSNKFHYFVVFDAGNNRYIAANAYGRIGYPAKVVDLGEYPTKDAALGVAMRKLRAKLAKGYEPTSFISKG
jgi:predicted DNA-binding WGR domain protein